MNSYYIDCHHEQQQDEQDVYIAHKMRIKRTQADWQSTHSNFEARCIDCSSFVFVFTLSSHCFGRQPLSFAVYTETDAAVDMAAIPRVFDASAFTTLETGDVRVCNTAVK